MQCISSPELELRTMSGDVISASSPQYAMFLSLVFLAELVAGISGFVFRHEVSAPA